MDIVKGGKLEGWQEHFKHGHVRYLRFPCPVGHAPDGYQLHVVTLKAGEHDAHNNPKVENVWGYRIIREPQPDKPGLMQIEPSVLYSSDPCQYHSSRPWQCEFTYVEQIF